MSDLSERVRFVAGGKTALKKRNPTYRRACWSPICVVWTFSGLALLQTCRSHAFLRPPRGDGPTPLKPHTVSPFTYQSWLRNMPMAIPSATSPVHLPELASLKSLARSCERVLRNSS